MIIQGDSYTVLKTLPSESVQCCITSPPYYKLRDYNNKDQIGQETHPKEYINKLINIFEEVKRILKKNGTLFLNIGDTYCTTPFDNIKSKDLIGIPWVLAFAMRDKGWYLRQDIIWNKSNCMPESVKDRCVKSHEYIFLFSKSKDYYFDNIEIAEGYDNRKKVQVENKKYFNGKVRNRWRFKEINNELMPIRNKRSVWTMSTSQITENHFAPFPEKLVETCILLGCPKNETVLDPFLGSGTTTYVAAKLNRKYIGIELNPEYIKITEKRMNNIQLMLL